MQLYRPGQTRLASRLKSDTSATATSKGDGGSGGSSVASGGGGRSSNSSTPSPVMPEEESKLTTSRHFNTKTNADGNAKSSVSSVTTSVGSASTTKTKTFRRSNQTDVIPVKPRDKDPVKQRYSYAQESSDKRYTKPAGRGKYKGNWDDDRQTNDTRSYNHSNARYEKQYAQKGNKYSKHGPFLSDREKSYPTHRRDEYTDNPDREKNYPTNRRDDYADGPGLEKSHPTHRRDEYPDNADREKSYPTNRRDEYADDAINSKSAPSDPTPRAVVPITPAGGAETKTGVSGKRYSRARSSKVAGTSVSATPPSSVVLSSANNE